MDNGHARIGGGIGGAGASTGIVCGWAVVSAGTGEADAGDTSRMPRVIRLRACGL